MDMRHYHNLYWIALLLCQFVADVQTVATVQMLSKGHRYVKRPGDTAQLHCEFQSHAFNLFNNPVQWKKTQAWEDTQMNMLGNLIYPFNDSSKFETDFAEEISRYTLRLRISNLTQEDSGNYTCEILSHDTQPLGSTTFQVYVQAPVTSIVLIDRTNMNQDSPVTKGIHILNDADTFHTRHDRRSAIVLTENKPSTLQCITRGGYPPPRVEVFLGMQNITNLFTHSTRTVLTGVAGMRLVEHIQDTVTHTFAATHDDDGEKLQCKVTVPDVGSNSSVVKLEVKYAPVVACAPASAFLGENLIKMSCDVRARPPAFQLYWVIDGNGTTLSGAQVANEYWTSNSDRGNGLLRSNLNLKKATSESFRTYVIIAKNILGRTQGAVTLTRRFHTTVAHVASQRPEPGQLMSNSHLSAAPSLLLHYIHSPTVLALLVCLLMMLEFTAPL